MPRKNEYGNAGLKLSDDSGYNRAAFDDDYGFGKVNETLNA